MINQNYKKDREISLYQNDMLKFTFSEKSFLYLLFDNKLPTLLFEKTSNSIFFYNLLPEVFFP